MKIPSWISGALAIAAAIAQVKPAWMIPKIKKPWRFDIFISVGLLEDHPIPKWSVAPVEL